jgi:hypothetical protein
VSYVQVGPFHCRADPCPRSLATRPSGQVTVEFGDGSQPTVLDVTVRAGEPAVKVAAESLLIEVRPQSNPISADAIPYELGHCGLYSGIDVDGSFWDPVGEVDPSHSDLINAAQAQFVMTSPTTARLTTEGGLTLELVRHAGPKYLPGCM